jgi:hypothetical protein
MGTIGTLSIGYSGPLDHHDAESESLREDLVPFTL